MQRSNVSTAATDADKPSMQVERELHKGCYAVSAAATDADEPSMQEEGGGTFNGVELEEVVSCHEEKYEVQQR